MLDALLEAWWTNHRLTRSLLDAVEDAGLACTLSRHGGRDVARQFAHVHDNRVAQIGKRGRGLGKDLRLFGAKSSPTRAALEAALDDSARGVEQLFRAIDAGKAGCMRKGPVTYLSYFVAHEAHHRGSILLTLKTCGHPVPRDVAMGLWAWDQA